MVKSSISLVGKWYILADKVLHIYEKKEKVLQVQKGHDGQSSTSSKTDEQCSTAILFK